MQFLPLSTDELAKDCHLKAVIDVQATLRTMLQGGRM